MVWERNTLGMYIPMEEINLKVDQRKHSEGKTGRT